MRECGVPHNLHGQDAQDWLRKAFSAASDRVVSELSDDAQRRGTGTTLTAAIFSAREVTVAHLGDSRAYHVCGSQINRLTTDHNIAQMLRSQGHDVPDPPAGPAAYLVRFIGVDHEGRVMEPQPDIIPVWPRPGDHLVLCTDGLTRVVGEDEIGDIVSKSNTTQSACEALIAVALERGGPDNVTVIVVRFEDLTGQDVPAQLA